MRSAWIVAWIALAAIAAPARAAPARADVTREATAVFRDFVASLGTQAPLTDGVELLITPFSVLQPPTAANLADHVAIFTGAKVSNVTVVPSASRRAAWLVAEVTAQMPDLEGPAHHDEVLRASAFVFEHDDHSWHVGAAALSQAFPDVVPGRCDPPTDEMRFEFRIPKDLYSALDAVLKALATGKLASLQSDDPRAIAIGSAPGERFTGGAAIKALLKKWKLGAPAGAADQAPSLHAYPALAGGAWSADLMWIAMSVRAPARLCTDYRALFVLAREGRAWRIVHQHYSQRFPSL